MSRKRAPIWAKIPKLAKRAGQCNDIHASVDTASGARFVVNRDQHCLLLLHLDYTRPRVTTTTASAAPYSRTADDVAAATTLADTGQCTTPACPDQITGIFSHYDPHSTNMEQIIIYFYRLLLIEFYIKCNITLNTGLY